MESIRFTSTSSFASSGSSLTEASNTSSLMGMKNQNNHIGAGQTLVSPTNLSRMPDPSNNLTLLNQREAGGGPGRENMVQSQTAVPPAQLPSGGGPVGGSKLF